MVTRTTTAGEGKLSIDRLCETVNGIDQHSKGVMFVALREMFPEIIWTHGHDGKVSGAVHQGYRP